MLKNVSVSDLPEFVNSLNKKEVYVKFILNYDKINVPAVIFPNPDDDGFYLLLTENPVEWFYDDYGVHDDNFTDSCLILGVYQKNSEIYNLSKFSCGTDIKHGWQVMNIVHAINKVFKLKSSKLQDYSRKESNEVPLRYWSMIRTGKTWYEHQGFHLENEDERNKFLSLETDYVAKKFESKYPDIVNELKKTKEPLFHKAANKIIDNVNISNILDAMFNEWFVFHEWKAPNRKNKRHKKMN